MPFSDYFPPFFVLNLGNTGGMEVLGTVIKYTINAMP
jgi:hypothetical protein